MSATPLADRGRRSETISALHLPTPDASAAGQVAHGVTGHGVGSCRPLPSRGRASTKCPRDAPSAMCWRTGQVPVEAAGTPCYSSATMRFMAA